MLKEPLFRKWLRHMHSGGIIYAFYRAAKYLAWIVGKKSRRR